MVHQDLFPFLRPPGGGPYECAEAIGSPLFNGNGWANTSIIQSEPLEVLDLGVYLTNNEGDS